jgi:hypothetical protein
LWWRFDGVPAMPLFRPRTLRAIERLERHIDNVRLHIGNVDEADMFEGLLAKAKASLLKPRRTGPKHLREILHGLVDWLCSRCRGYERLAAALRVFQRSVR